MTQRNYRQAFGLKILNSNHAKVRHLKKEGYVAEIHGNKFWNSSFLIMSYLQKHRIPKKYKVLEIGCGWGMLGLFCAREFGNKAHGIDADKNVLPYLQLHAEINGQKMFAEKKNFNQLTVEYLSQFDIILGADICFWDEMAEQLLRLIGRAKRAGVRQVLIADPCRPPFTDLSMSCEQKFENVELVTKFLRRPVRASGEILIVS